MPDLSRAITLWVIDGSHSPDEDADRLYLSPQIQRASLQAGREFIGDSVSD